MFRRKIIILFVLLLFTCGSGMFAYQIYANEEIKRIESIQFDALSALESLYDDNHSIKKDVSRERVQEVEGLVSKVEDLNQKIEMQTKLAEIIKYIELRERIESLFEGDVLKSDSTTVELDTIQQMSHELATNVQILLDDRIKEAISQKQKIEDAKSTLSMLFYEDGSLLETVDRSDYNSVIEKFESLPQKDIINKYQMQLNDVLDFVVKKEEIAYAAQKKREREASEVHVLQGVPVINQIQEQVYNGCEVASLLMGLQYKGYATNMTLTSMAMDIPKSSDPHQGFVSSIFNFQPTTIVHWIAPDALAAYGKTFDASVEDITGASTEDLVAEVIAGNPVIVYVTDDYQEPGEQDGEVFFHLHVQLLIGYDPNSDTYILNDPGKNQIRVSGNRFRYIYNLLQFAVAVR